MEVAFENVYILVHEGTISSRNDLLPLLEQITKSGRPVLIIAEDITGGACHSRCEKAEWLSACCRR
jgi:chaperonin GroEL